MSRSFRTLIVDDEKPARQRLLALLGSRPEIEVIGACAGGEAALRMLKEAASVGQRIDVLFLDVQMPEIDGFDVLDALCDETPAALPVVVFVTAYDQYALRAFDAHAADYLLKPYSDERFDAALQRAVQIVRGASSNEILERICAVLNGVQRNVGPDTAAEPRYLDRILLKTRGRAWLLSTTEIRWIGAAGVYVEIHTKNGKAHLHRELLGRLETQLDPSLFVRIHRSHVVRLDAIEELIQNQCGSYAVRLDDGTELKLSRSYRTHVRQSLGQHAESAVPRPSGAPT